MKLYRLNNTVLSFRNNPVSFLNGLTTNDMTAPHNAFLNLHGRIIATFEQAKISDDEIWIVVANSAVEALTQHLERYVKLGGVKMQKRDDKVYFDLDNASHLVISQNEYPSNVSEEEFRLFRLKHNIPLHGVDYTDEMILNVGYDFVSFTKGCYLGQEFVSKVHNRSKPTWKLVVKAEEDCSEEEKAKLTSKAFDPQTAKTLGFVFVKNE